MDGEKVMSKYATELIGGPLDGMQVDIDLPLDYPNFHSVRMICTTVSIDDNDEEVEEWCDVIIYRVTEWKNGTNALVFEGYEN